MEQIRFNRIIQRIKYAIALNEKHGKYNDALSLIKLCASLLYESNQYYRDDELEDAIERIANNITTLKNMRYDKEIVLFYDGFGMDNRGLALIYIKALCNSDKKVLYVTSEKYKEQIFKITQILNEHNYNPIYLSSISFDERIKELVTIIDKHKAGTFIFYSMPDDVVGVSVMNINRGRVINYQINLTDHTFWLGAKPIDYCIEFRDYGASISLEQRHIEPSKMVCLPYYPAIDEGMKFNGYPEGMDSSKKIIFSGGALYKTLGDNNKYYTIVEHILSNYEDVIFWYAGSGDDTEIRKILNKFGRRAFHTSERRDLHQVLEKCYLYLSTYPVCGGLMFQYAARAGKIPVTLKNSNISDDFLLGQDELGIEFDTLDELYEEIDRLIQDVTYHDQKERLIKKAVVTPSQFDESVQYLLDGRDDKLRKINIRHIDTESFRKIYMEQLTEDRVDSIIGHKEYKTAIKYFPIRYLKGYIGRKIRR